MKFKVDENLPEEVAELLQQVGYDALTVYDQELAGSADSAIAAICHQEGRVIISLDMGFSDIRAYPPKLHPGLIVLRFRQQDKIHVMEVFQRVVQLIHSEPLENKLWIVNEHQVRIQD